LLRTPRGHTGARKMRHLLFAIAALVGVLMVAQAAGTF
jgi:hypothetical protein